MTRSILTLALLIVPSLAHAQPGAGTFERVTAFGANPGGLEMHRYVPSPAPSGPAPVVFALHGCTQNVSTFRNTGWEPLADELGFYVVYPAQTSANNPVSCFNWAGEYGDEANLRRGEGENASLIAMLDRMESDFAVSDAYVMGHSAGAAMAMVMLATWPERFAAGGVIAGIPYRCATSVSGAFSCQSPGVDRSPAEWGQLVRDASSHAGPWPRLSIWHGTSDGIVVPANQREALDQWTSVMGLPREPTATETVDGHARQTFSQGGRVMIESWEIAGAGHATFVDPDTGCGAVAAYVSDEDICAVRHMAAFFGLSGAPPIPPPVGDGGPATLPDGGPAPAPSDAGSWSWGDRDAGPGVTPGPGPGEQPMTSPDSVHVCGCAVSSGPVSGGWLALPIAALLLARRRRILGRA
ncbi:MAG: PHB depolymerase family esterase [Myxococcota bacterium]|nr:PHB depolymerase family esterase [Myxococcota bacterium]